MTSSKIHLDLDRATSFTGVMMKTIKRSAQINQNLANITRLAKLSFLLTTMTSTPPTKAALARISGRCLCGGIHFSFDSKIGQILQCHCSQCRRSSGARFVPYVALQRQALMKAVHNNIQNTGGKKAKYPLLSTITLSEVATRHFCTACGSLICMDYHAPNTVWVPLGILDDESASNVVA
jgi:hypothetical protein